MQIYSNAQDAVIPNYNNYGMDLGGVQEREKRWDMNYLILPGPYYTGYCGTAAPCKNELIFLIYFFLNFSSKRCHCNCHGSDKGSSGGVGGPNQKVLLRNKLNVANKEEASQTLSTGDIVITKIYFKENQDKGEEKTLVPSQKK